ncbi:MAG: hypothetical protein ACR2IV_05905 [Bryobacteraceae bacterium]
MARPNFKPTEENRNTVRMMLNLNASQEEIAVFLRIAPKTLRKHFRRELELGPIEANIKVGRALFRMAASGNNFQATRYWDRTRGFGRPRPGEMGSPPMPPPQIIFREDDQATQQAAAGGPVQ